MKIFTVSTGSWQAKVRAPSGQLAAAMALRRDKPKTLGMLVMIESPSEQTTWWDIREALKMAGLQFQTGKRKAKKAK